MAAVGGGVWRWGLPEQRKRCVGQQQQATRVAAAPLGLESATTGPPPGWESAATLQSGEQEGASEGLSCFPRLAGFAPKL